MYLKADKITIDSDDNGLSLWIETDTGPVAVNMHGVDLEALAQELLIHLGWQAPWVKAHYPEGPR